MNRLIAVGIATAVLVVPVLAAAQVTASTLPDPGTLPDSPFYFLKSWREQIQLFFTFSAEKKAEQYLHLAEVRLAEYQKMIEKGKEDVAKRTLEKYEEQLSRALAKAEELKEKGEEVADELKREAEETAARHLKVLEQNLDKVSESAKGGIERALEASKKQLEKLDDLFGEESDDLFERAEGGFNDKPTSSDRRARNAGDLDGLQNLIDDGGLENELEGLLEGLE